MDEYMFGIIIGFFCVVIGLYIPIIIGSYKLFKKKEKKWKKL